MDGEIIPAAASAVAALAALALVIRQIGIARNQNSISAYDSVVSQLINFKKEFSSRPELLTKTFPGGPPADGDVIPPGMSSDEFFLFTRGVWVFSLIFSVWDSDIRLTRYERDALRREIAIWLGTVHGFRVVWRDFTEPTNVHNIRFREWVNHRIYGPTGDAYLDQLGAGVLAHHAHHPWMRRRSGSPRDRYHDCGQCTHQVLPTDIARPDTDGVEGAVPRSSRSPA